MFSNYLEKFDVYINALHAEQNCINKINAKLKKFKYKNPDPKTIEYINKMKAIIDEQLAIQIKLMKVLMRDENIDIIILLKTANVPDEIANQVLSFLKRIKPYSNDENDINAYYEYLNSIFCRLILFKDINTVIKIFEKMNQEAMIKIKRTFDGTAIESSRQFNQYQYYPMQYNVKLLNCIHVNDQSKFDHFSGSENSIYKRGINNINHNEINELIIKLDLPQKSHLFICSSTKGKKIIVYYYMVTHLMTIVHEELHGIRMLRGASRGKNDSILPTVLQLAYDNIEEYFNILIGKSSEDGLSRIYNMPKRITHLGFLYDINDASIIASPQWQENLIIARATLGLNEFSKFDLRGCNKKILKELVLNGCDFRKAKVNRDVKKNLLSLKPKKTKKINEFISLLFYGEDLSDINKLKKMIDVISSDKYVIPGQQSILHILAQFSHLWREDKQIIAHQLASYGIKLGLLINQVDENGFTPFMYAVKNLNKNMIKYFLELEYPLTLSLTYKNLTHNTIEELINTGIKEDNFITTILKILAQFSFEEFNKAIKSDKKNPLIKCMLTNNFNFFNILINFYDKNQIGKIKEGNKDIFSIFLDQIIQGNIDVLFYYVFMNSISKEDKEIFSQMIDQNPNYAFYMKRLNENIVKETQEIIEFSDENIAVLESPDSINNTILPMSLNHTEIKPHHKIDSYSRSKSDSLFTYQLFQNKNSSMMQAQFKDEELNNNKHRKSY